MGTRRSSWHAADGSSITVSPPSGGRSEELPPHLLLACSFLPSPSLLLASPGCYEIQLEEEPRREQNGEAVKINYLFTVGGGAVKGWNWCFCTF